MKSRVLQVAVLAWLAASAGCKREAQPTPAPTPQTTEKTAEIPAEAAVAVVKPTIAADSGTPGGPMLAALMVHTPVMSAPEWPLERDPDTRKKMPTGSVQIGYIRQGSQVAIKSSTPLPGRGKCSEGWFELVQGGFVCGKYASTDVEHPKVRLAPHAPYLDQPLPYEYGYNLVNGTPLYRRVPSRAERSEAESMVGKKMVAAEDATDDTFLNPKLSASDGGVPWYARSWDGGKPQVTLDDLRGEGPVERRMVRGFFLSLDKTMTANGAKWWRTADGKVVNSDKIIVTPLRTDFHGVWLDARGPATNLPVNGEGVAGVSDVGALAEVTATEAAADTRPVAAFVVRKKSAKYVFTAKGPTFAGELPHHAAVRLTGRSTTAAKQTYWETGDTYWVKANEVVLARRSATPKGLAAGEKWIEVNLGTQTIILYEGDTPVYSTLTSTGKKDRQNKEKDHSTPPGDFRIREKHVAATMDGDVASDGPYSIQDVPWIMYYSGSYALHGAFWHTNFGFVRSHGCSNLAPTDGRTIFNWTEPTLPEGWHGVNATESNPGTRVIVRPAP